MVNASSAITQIVQPLDLSAYIIDQSEAMQNTLDQILREMGVFVCGRSNEGRRALHWLRVLKPDLILLDVQIPGTTGIEVFSDVREASPESKPVILTTLCERSLVVDCRRLGASDYVLKPFERNDLKSRLVRVIRNLLTERQAIPESEPALMKMLFDRARGKIGACCRHCGKNNPLENVFCGMCGRPIDPLRAAEPDAAGPGEPKRDGTFYASLLTEARRDKKVFMTCESTLKQSDIQEIFNENSDG